MEGVVSIRNQRLVLKETTAEYSVSLEEHSPYHDARTLALHILKLLGPKELKEETVGILWDSANSDMRNKVIRDTLPATWEDYRTYGIWSYYRDLPAYAKAHVKGYFEKLVDAL